MNIFIGWWGIPAVISLVTLALFFWFSAKDLEQDYGFHVPIYAILGILSSLGSWTVYFAVMYFTK